MAVSRRSLEKILAEWLKTHDSCLHWKAKLLYILCYLSPLIATVGGSSSSPSCEVEQVVAEALSFAHAGAHITL